jgi:pectin methylesterase-like acyl-CoA thioesterase
MTGRRAVGGTSLIVAMLAFEVPALAQTIVYVPANGAAGVNPDTHLTITCPGAPVLGGTATVRIYDAASDKVVDTLDLAIPPGPTAGPGALAGRVPYTPVPYEYTTGPRATNADTVPGTPSGVAAPTPPTSQLTIIGGFTDAFHFYPVIVHDNVVTIYPHNDLLAYGRTYYVQIDPGVLTCGRFSGLTGKQAWRFSTKRRPPPAGSSRFVVAADGSGDFDTVQGALDFVPDRGAARVTIFVRDGDYEEIVYARNKSNVTIVGQDRDKVQIHYANSEIFNPHPSNVATNEWPGTFPSRRAAFMLDQADAVHLVNLTIRNTARGQAEGLLITGQRNVVSHVSVYGSGDALQVNGSVYVSDSLVVGDGDTILGRGPAFFRDCELRSRGPFTWTRNTSANHGTVLVNCRLTATGGEPAVIARAPTNGGRTYPNAEVVLLSCTLDGISPAGWGEIGGDPSHVRYWEYDSRNARDGSLADVSARDPASKQLNEDRDAQTIADYRNPAWVLGGWSPVMAPIILSGPASLTVAPGQSLTLKVTAAAIPDAAYQWFKNGAPVAGTTGRTLTFAALRPADAGTYAVAVTNTAGTTRSQAATLTVKGVPHSSVKVTYINRPSRWICSVTGEPDLSACRRSRNPLIDGVAWLLTLRTMSRGCSGTSVAAPPARATTRMPQRSRSPLALAATFASSSTPRMPSSGIRFFCGSARAETESRSLFSSTAVTRKVISEVPRKTTILTGSGVSRRRNL